MATSRTSENDTNCFKRKASRRLALAIPVVVAAAALAAGLGAVTYPPIASAAATTTPSAPSATVAVAGSTSAAVSWKAPASSGGLKVTGYYVTSHRGSHAGRPKWFAGTGTTAKMTGLKNGTGYQFTVTADNADGNGSSSGWSNYIIPTTVPRTPSKVTATASGGGATIWWAAGKATFDPTTAYQITPYSNGKALIPIQIRSTVTAQTITGLHVGTTYRFSVEAVNDIGHSAPSALTKPMKVVSDPTTFNDAFSGSAHSNPNAGLTKPVWNLDGCWSSGCGNQSDAQYVASNTYQNGHGDLVLRATKKTTGAKCGSRRCHYTGAGLQMFNSNGSPTFSQRYGTFSARVMLPSGSGLWPAFWLAGSNATTVGWPVCGEIDALEADGANTTTVQQHIHYGSVNTQIGSGWRLPAGQSTAGWHTYSITWSPAGIVWKVDGHSTMVVLASTVGAAAWARSFAHPFSVILDLTVGGKFVSAPKASSFPATMLVDDVRITRS